MVALVAAFVMVATLVPSVDQTSESLRSGAATGRRGGLGTGAGGIAAAGGTGSESGAAAAATETTEGGGVAAAPASPCADRDRQVPGDPYSPPCIAFEGENGGATARGVTPAEILVSVRLTDEPGFQDALAQVAGADISDTPEDIRRTVEALMEYFNSRFQLYGRKMTPVFFKGKGALVNELLGGGQEEAEADAVTAAEEIGAFAEFNGSSMPFADALTARGVLAFGAPYAPRRWHQQRRPYSWSIATDCSIIVETVVEYASKRLYGSGAEWARGDVANKPRKSVALAPDNPEYQACVDDGMAEAKSLGVDPGMRLAYKLDLSSMSNQATNVIAKLKKEGVTSVLCGCDPIFPVFLSAKAKEQDYWPEWIVTGTALTDIDIVGQLYDQDQWSRAFGVSYLGAQQPMRASFGYSAYKAVRDDEPAFAVDIIYYQMYMLALGIHMAGPVLTPESFEKGMFAYPGGTGPAGTWGFGPNSYTPTQDAREIYWDPTATSPMNGKKGAYIETEPGVRYRKGQWPKGRPAVFQ